MITDHRYLQASSFIRSKFYHNLIGVTYEGKPIPSKIKAVFVGTNDPIMSSHIFGGVIGDYPDHNFTDEDLNNLHLWVGLADRTVLPVSEVLNSEFLQSLCKQGAMKKNIIVGNEWSEPIRIPPGLSVRLLVKNEANLEYKLYDKYKPTNTTSKKECADNHVFWLKYYHDHLDMKNMVEPTISFRISDNPNKQTEIVLEFLDE